MIIAIIGAGAMGCRFGASFLEAGSEIWLYDVWREHIQKIQEEGLTIEDDTGEKRLLSFHAVHEIREVPVADIVIIFTKSMYTKAAVTEALPIIGSHTVLLTLQNGLGNIEDIREVTAGKPIIAGTTNYASDLLGPGHVELKGSGLTKMTALDKCVDERAEQLTVMLRKAGHHAEVSRDVMIEIWEKVAFNAALNTTTAITGLTVGGMGKLPVSRELLFDIASEIISVARSEGIAADECRVHKTIESVFDSKMSGDHKTSMLQDRILKRKTEIEAICGKVIELGKIHGVDVPRLECIYALIKTIENNYGNSCFENK